MRERLITELEDSPYLESTVSKPHFLVYLMGPYKSYPPYPTPPTHDVSNAATSRPTLNEINDRIEDDQDFSSNVDDALALLLYLRDELREKAGVNAFIATDPQIETDEIDAATQSLAFTRAANATIFVTPAMGDNLGVGIETGAICESLPAPALLEEVLFTEERDVDSEMIRAVSDRWHVTTDDFANYQELIQAVKAHLRIIAQNQLSTTTTY
ncbi:DUF7509 family protein [Natronobeatus ordinarius]|uniref:DUF7509 family protein n=1 Tax=Natronobeatus ordinarius TaxID=2963433 RepID=UPI0020CDAAD2|nr:hypothetical protein [Natronobeatus ordinarius]